MLAGRFWNRTDSRCRPSRVRAPEANEPRGAAAFDPPLTLLLSHSLRCGRAAGVLAGLFAMALEILVGSGRGSAARPASHGPGILYVARNGPSRTAGKIVARGVWARTGFYVCRLGDRVGAV